MTLVRAACSGHQASTKVSFRVIKVVENAPLAAKATKASTSLSTCFSNPSSLAFNSSAIEGFAVSTLLLSYFTEDGSVSRTAIRAAFWLDLPLFARAIRFLRATSMETRLLLLKAVNSSKSLGLAALLMEAGLLLPRKSMAL